MSDTLPESLSYHNVRTCPCCGLAQTLPPAATGMRPCCARCHTRLEKRRSIAHGRGRTAAIALAALILYPLAITLPMVRVEKFGHHNDASILTGIAKLFAAGHLVVAVIVLLCSIVIPLCKLVALLVLSAGGSFLRHQHRAFTYHVVEWTGRWGMLDVLLVAILVAVLKVGDLVEVTAGPAATAFTCCVVLSLIATATFDPHSLWPTRADEAPQRPPVEAPPRPQRDMP
jgi:paraquat-inducible protein A